MEGLITKARSKWELLHADDEVEQEMMLPLIRLKVGIHAHAKKRYDKGLM